MSPSKSTTIYLDFLCPYAHRGVELADVLRAQGEPFVLRHYSLVQGNHPANAEQPGPPRWWLSEQFRDLQPPSDVPPGAHFTAQMQLGSLRAFLAAQAAALQGEDARWNFTLALQRARHERQADLSDATIQAAAQESGLDWARFERDVSDADARRHDLRGELRTAAQAGVVATPTFALAPSRGQASGAAYFRLGRSVPPQDVTATWALYVAVMENGAHIETIKRAKPHPVS